jgi:hypothetical protein
VPKGATPAQAEAFLKQSYVAHLLDAKTAGIYLSAALMPGLERSVSDDAATQYVDQFLKDAGSPTDPVERVLLQQLAILPHAIGRLHLQCRMAGSAEERMLYLSATTDYLAELRRLALALKDYREPGRAQSSPDSSEPATNESTVKVAQSSAAGAEKIRPRNEVTSEPSFDVQSSDLSTKPQACGGGPTQPVEKRPDQRRGKRAAARQYLAA